MKEGGNERRTPERSGSEHEGLVSSSVSEKRPLPGVALSPRARGGRATAAVVHAAWRARDGRPRPAASPAPDAGLHVTRRRSGAPGRATSPGEGRTRASRRARRGRACAGPYAVLTGVGSHLSPEQK